MAIKHGRMLTYLDCFYYINGRFPAYDNLVNVPKGEIPDFILTDRNITPLFM